MIQIFFAFLAGILTIAAPCILLPLPIILGGSIGRRNKMRPLFLVAGFILSFSILAIAISYLVRVFGVDPNLLRTIAAILLFIFAIFMIWPQAFEKIMSKFSLLLDTANKTSKTVGQDNWGAFVLGSIIGIIWAPCAGPILASILTLIALQENFAQASGLLFAYAIGAGLPMLLLAYGSQAITTKIKKVAKYAHHLQRIFGIILIFLAIAIYFQYDALLQAKILTYMPNIGSNIEEKLLGTSNNINKSNKDMVAPEFVGISEWLNSEPLTLKELKGKVVLVDFWTYSCINCIRTIPHITEWHKKYKDYGLVIVGVHSPEFAFEKDRSNVANAIDQYNIKYPVALDNNFSTWRAYANQYWPAEYLIDQQGNIVYTHFGEGEYENTENAIRALLGLTPLSEEKEAISGQNTRSPEMYFGLDRLQYLHPQQYPSLIAVDYKLPKNFNLNQFALSGVWRFNKDSVSLVKGSGKIKLKFYSAKLFMVAQSVGGANELQINVDGQTQPSVTVESSDLYTLFDSDDYNEHTVEINIPESGFDAFTFTFG